MIRWILSRTVIAFILSFVFHFAFDFLGRPTWLVGLFPMNESIWEHLKLPFYSLMVVFFVFSSNPEKKESDFYSKVIAIAVSAAFAMGTVFFGYYGLKCGLGIEGIVIDLLLLVFGLLLGLFHAEKIGNERKTKCSFLFVASLSFLIMMIFFFYFFSIRVPNFPVFQG